MASSSNPEQCSLLGGQQQQQLQSQQRYDSLGSLAYSLSVVDERADTNRTNGDSSHQHFRPRSFSGTAQRVALIFGVALIVGLVFWVATYSYEWDSDDMNFGGGRSSSIFFGSHDDDDDDDYTYERSNRGSWVDLLPVPLLGRSHVYKAQEAADQARDFLYVNHDLEEKHHKKHSTKHVEDLVLGSNGRNRYEGDISVSAPDGCEGTVMIMRHCEKGSIREHCDYMGYERSVYLASLFGNDVHHRWPEPSYLVAEAPGYRRNPEKQNFRELETILPLADKFNLTVEKSYSSLETNQLARKIQGMLRSGDMCGKLMVISWKHSKIPRLAHDLGCGPREGCPWHYRGKRFDEIWQLKFAYRMPLHSTRKHLVAPTNRKWMVFGAVQTEGFDPLSFSKRVGDYPGKHGTNHGARWLNFDYEIPEREVATKHKKKQWDMLHFKHHKKD